MKPLPHFRDDPNWIETQLAAFRRGHKGRRDLERRLVIARCRQIRAAVRKEKRARS